MNDVPEMRLVVDVERAGEQPRRITLTQLIDLGSIPRAGERVYVMIDPISTSSTDTTAKQLVLDIDKIGAATADE